MTDAGTIVGALIGGILGLIVLRGLFMMIFIVHEKEVVVIERCGKYSSTLTAGIHLVIPYVDRAKRYTHRYFITDDHNRRITVEKKRAYKISTQNLVLDFPKQQVISRDNAMIHLDAVLSFRVTNPKTMIYNSVNLPWMLSKLLQAQVRNVAGTMDVDQLIDDASVMSSIAGKLEQNTQAWGVSIDFVKIQRVEAGNLTSVLERKKQAELKNKEIVIDAKNQKQVRIIESEGQRDRIIKEAEGEAQQMLSRARGQAQAIENQAEAEAKAVKEIARALTKAGENPTQYLLSLKYIDALQKITALPNTAVQYMPKQTSFVQTASSFGMNTIMPAGSGGGRRA